jgi:hypothetical protein
MYYVHVFSISKDRPKVPFDDVRLFSSKEEAAGYKDDWDRDSVPGYRMEVVELPEGEKPYKYFPAWVKQNDKG